MKHPSTFLRSLILLAASFGSVAGLAVADDTEKPVRPPAAPADSGASEPAANFAQPDHLIDAGTYRAVDGSVFQYRKQVLGGEDTMAYTRGDLVLDQAGMDAYERAHAPPTLDDTARAAAADAGPAGEVELLVWLRNRPGASIARRVRKTYEPEIEALAAEIQSIQRSVRPSTPLDVDGERAYIESLTPNADPLTPLQRSRVDDLGAEIEAATAVMREEMASQIRAAVADDQAAFAATVLTMGGTVISTAAGANAASIRLPANRLDDLAADRNMARIIATPQVEPELNNQLVSLGVTTGFHNDGLCGGIWDAGILDTGVQQNHPALNPASWLSNFGTTDSDGHGTGIAGIIASQDATFRGLAYCLDAILVGSFSGANVMSHANWMVSTASQDPEAINLSGGYGIANDTDYSTFDSFWDGLIDDNSVLVCKSTGNSNDDDPDGDDTNNITHPAPAYNLVAVANIFDQNTVTRSDDRITSDSSRGPTLNGRKKPDLAAPGSSTLTTNNDWATGPDFIRLGGTSAAAPKCTAAQVLLTELRGLDTPFANKAVMINTADAWSDNGTPGPSGDDGEIAGSQWNPVYGWGYMDLGEAWFNGTDVFTDTVDDGVTPPGLDYKLYRGFMFGNEKATLAWNRHVGFNGSNNPTAVESLTDLDLVLYDPDGNLIQNAHEGGNNVEQLAAPTAGDYVLKVDVFGVVDPDVGIESYGLATEEGWVQANGPSYSIGVSLSGVSPNQSFTFEATVTNTGDVGSATNNVTLGLPGGYTLVSGDNPQAIGSIPVGGDATATWVVTAPCSTGSSFFSVTNNAVSVGETFVADTFPFVTPNTITLTDDVPISSSAIERTFDFQVLSFDWVAVAMDPQGVDHDVWADDDQCIDTPYQTSTLGGPARDFTVTNGVIHGGATHYALATFGSPSPYTIEMDQADDLTAGASLTRNFTAGEVVEMFEVGMTAGRSYEITVEVTSGTVDPSLFYYPSNVADGDRASANESSVTPGAGVTETLIVDAAVTGNHGVAVINDNSQAGNFTFSVREVLFADGFESGNTSAWAVTVP